MLKTQNCPMCGLIMPTQPYQGPGVIVYVCPMAHVIRLVAEGINFVYDLNPEAMYMREYERFEKETSAK